MDSNPDEVRLNGKFHAGTKKGFKVCSSHIKPGDRLETPYYCDSRPDKPRMHVRELYKIAIPPMKEIIQFLGRPIHTRTQLIDKEDKMDNDQQVAVLRQLNLNDMGESSLDLSWQDSFAPTSHMLVSNNNGSDQQDQNSDCNKNQDKFVQRDLEFIRKHASEADADFILSLLHSQIDNPNRLETIMCDMLNIPNAAELIQDFRRQPAEGEGNPSATSSYTGPTETKKENRGADIYLQQIRDMFPDADGLFLISECQQLESWEDFSRFVNTVMISGVYPKKGAVEFSSETKPTKVVDITDSSDYRTTENLSSDEEISSSGLIETPRKRRRRKKDSKNVDSRRGEPQKWFALSEIDVIDLSSDTTEPCDPVDHETLQEMFNWREGNNESMEVEEVLPGEPKSWETNLVDDIDNLLQAKFGTPSVVFEIPETPIPGPSRSTPLARSRLSLPGRTTLNFDDSIGEKSLAEIIEEKRSHRRASLASPIWVEGRASTSKADFLGTKSLLKEALGQTESEVSSPEVSTSSQATQPGSETDGGFEEGEDFPKVSEEWLAEQIANLIRIFPNTDPSYLREEVIKMDGSSDAVNEFVIAKLERNDMPTRAEYEKKMEMEELQSRYTKNFSIEDFLKAVPDPWAYFTQGNRNCAKYKSHSLCYLKSAFRKHYVRDIVDTFHKNNCNLYLSYTNLKKAGMKRRGSRRSEFECNHNRPTTIDIQFLQEVAFIENEAKIKDYLEGEKIARQIKFDEAKRTGSLLECQCCFDSEILVEEIYYCPKDHAFCKSCIVRSVEVEMGYGRYKFECLANCEEKFTLACLQNVLKPELFSKVIQVIQMEEIRAAGIEDLVQCPFCNYATIMPPEEKVMICLNPECLKESCRLCKELNHIPLRCDEVEKSEEVKMRTYIENKMTEALVRTCHKCGKSFVKEDGCNKMTCTCGAKMCYVCRKPVTDYSHFNGQGGTEYHKCPLYSTNDELHVELVKRVGEEAKAVILQANPQAKLLHDPTAIAPQRTHQTPMPGINNGAALDVAMRAVMGALNHEDNEVEAQRRHRERREIRREATPYYNRHHRHRQRVQPESENEDEEVQHTYNHNHHHRHRQAHIQDYRHRHYHHHHHHQHHHHHNVNYSPI